MKTLHLLPLMLAAAAAAASEPDLGRCRAIDDAKLRLACYDALPWAPVAGASAAAPAVAPAPPPAAASFGLAPAADEVQQITSYFPGRFEGWSRNTRLRLANGQVWQVIDDSTAFYNHLQDPKVTVRRAAMGSFMMDIEGARSTPRVRRVE